MKKELKLPKFKNNREEVAFWSKIDLADYLEAKDLQEDIIPDLKTKTKPVSFRLPVNVLNRIKSLAAQRDIPYQSLMKDFVFRGLSQAL